MYALQACVHHGSRSEFDMINVIVGIKPF